jgi:catechol 2,3-dioxygenase-like lactoylglutathione lyase family enzyme
MCAAMPEGTHMDPKLSIRSIDYTVIYARQMSKMREFYGITMGFPLHRELSPKWVEYRVGSNILALAEPGTRFNDPLPPVGVMSLQLAFRVAPQEVDACAASLEERGVAIVSRPTDELFGHRTLSFRDPDGNVLEIYAEIVPLAQRT